MKGRNKKYVHLSLEERVEIYSLSQQGKSYRRIAELVERDVGTISRELRRNRTVQYKEYTPVKAHQISRRRLVQQRTKAPLKNPAVLVYVRQKLRDDQWTPEQIAGRLPRDIPGESISTETIYAYIYGKGKTYKLWEHLPRSHRKRRTKTGRSTHQARQSKIPGAVSIEKRMPKAEKRNQVGHIETDLMEGKRGTQTVVSVETERKTRYVLLTKLADKRSLTKMKRVTEKLKMIQSLSKVIRPLVRTVTADNGPENTRHQQIAREVGAKVYFCHPYHSWEKGTVENMIGRVRRFIPKGTNLSEITETQLQWVENKLNNTPRKCLGYLTPKEALEIEANTHKFRKYQQLKEESVALQPRM